MELVDVRKKLAEENITITTDTQLAYLQGYNDGMDKAKAIYSEP